MSDVVDDSCVYHAIGDMLYHIEHEGQLPEFWFRNWQCKLTLKWQCNKCSLECVTVILRKVNIFPAFYWSTQLLLQTVMTVANVLHSSVLTV